MKIEKLISDYIDGDLSREQDKLLRDIINEDEFAKRKFESSVDIHMALKEDAASVNTPDDIERETEDLIMMKILNHNNSADVVKSKRRKPVFFYLSAAVLVIMFGIIFRFYEIGSFAGFLEKDNQITYNQYIEGLDPNTFNIAVPEEFTYEDNYSSVAAIQDNPDNISSGNSNSSKASNYESEISDDIAVSNFADEKLFFKDTLNEINNSVFAFEDDNFSIAEEPDLLSISENQSGGNFRLNSNAKNIPFNGLIIMNNNFPDYIYLPGNINIKSNKIKISSFVSNSFINKGLKTNKDEAIVNYSQSVAYHSSEKLSFGLEFGYIHFNALRNVNSSNSGNSTNELSVNSSVEVQDPTKGEDFIPARLPVVVSNQLFWGSVFVNYDLYNYNNLVLEGRFGTGSTSDGPLSYARIQAKYKIYDGIYLNLGSEGRVFIYSMEGKKSTASNLSLIYGIQFAF